MLDAAFTSVFGTADSLVSAVSPADFLVCCLASIVLGMACAGVYMFRHSYSKNFVVTLALLPLIVQMVITLVNGNLGAGIAVMGVFNLVRFRSIPGSAKDIGSVFLAMAVGLAEDGVGAVVLVHAANLGRDEAAGLIPADALPFIAAAHLAVGIIGAPALALHRVFDARR